MSGGPSFDIPQLWYVPTLGNVTLGAVSAMVDAGLEFVVNKRTGQNAMAIASEGEVFCVVPAVDGLYTACIARSARTAPIFVNGLSMSENLSANLGYVAGACGQLRANCYTGEMGITELVHRRFGHVSWGNQRLAKRLRAILGPKAGVGHNCGACEACLRRCIVSSPVRGLVGQRNDPSIVCTSTSLAEFRCVVCVVEFIS